VLCVIGFVMDVLLVEGAVIGSRPAMTAQGVHTDSVAAVAGKQAEFEVEEVERSAKMAAMMQHFLAVGEVEHCPAKTAAALEYFQEKVEIGVDCCYTKNWVVRWML
jgi:hypothetical protein